MAGLIIRDEGSYKFQFKVKKSELIQSYCSEIIFLVWKQKEEKEK